MPTVSLSTTDHLQNLDFFGKLDKYRSVMIFCKNQASTFSRRLPSHKATVVL